MFFKSSSLFFALFLWRSLCCLAQESSVPEYSICYASEMDAHSSILFPEKRNLRTEATSSIEVTYTNFPSSAKIAFEEAVKIWESILISPQTIRINASWESLPGRTLAYSGATRVFRNFDKVPYFDVWYVVPLAEAISGKDLNPGEFDINVTLNRNINWSYATNGTSFSGKFDLVTVALHEIAHGLGFSSSMKLINDDSEGQWGQTGYPYIYDLFLQDAAARQLINKSNFVNPSSSLKTVLESGDLFFQISNSKYANDLPKVHSPNPYKSGGSISHLDEKKYPPGSMHSLMSPTIKSAEVIHDPGELILSMMNEIGWPVNNLESFTVLSKQKEEPILVYPNPVSERLSVAIPLDNRSAGTSFEFFSSEGRILKTIQINTLNTPTPVFDLSAFQTGVYFLRINTPQGFFTKRFVKF